MDRDVLPLMCHLLDFADFNFPDVHKIDKRVCALYHSCSRSSSAHARESEVHTLLAPRKLYTLKF